MVGGYQMVDVNGLFAVDSETGAVPRTIPGIYRIASQRHKPVMISAFQFDGGSMYMEVNPQYVGFRENDGVYEARISAGEHVLLMQVYNSQYNQDQVKIEMVSE